VYNTPVAKVTVTGEYSSGTKRDEGGLSGILTPESTVITMSSKLLTFKIKGAAHSGRAV
jgi:hypothetical protein